MTITNYKLLEQAINAYEGINDLALLYYNESDLEERAALLRDINELIIEIYGVGIVSD